MADMRNSYSIPIIHKTPHNWTRIFTTVFMLFLTANISQVYSQSPRKVKAFGVESLNGIISLESDYRALRTIPRNYSADTSQSMVFAARFGINATTYLLHPNLFLLSTDLEYAPGLARNQYIASPDRSETHTAENIRLQATIVKDLPVSLSGFWNYHHAFIDREIVTSEEILGKHYGGSINYRNKFAPLTLSYRNEDTRQDELATGRVFTTKRDHLQFDIRTQQDPIHTHRLSMSFDDLKRKYFAANEVMNTNYSAHLENGFVFDSARSTLFRSNISFYDQTGTSEYRRIQVGEVFTTVLPLSFKSSLQYQFMQFAFPDNTSNQHLGTGILEHKLFESVQSFIQYDYAHIDQTILEQKWQLFQLDIRYRKKLPLDGLLQLGYHFSNRTDKLESRAAQIAIRNEVLVLDDASIITLSNPNIVATSIVITDPTETIYYDEHFDYELILRGPYIEVLRIPGGRIANGEIVWTDYNVSHLSSYNYTSSGSGYTGSISLFDRFIEGYGKIDKLAFDEIETQSFRQFKWYSQTLYGIRLRYSIFNAKAERDEYETNIIPYTSTRYMLNASGKIWSNFNVAVTAKYRDILLIDADERQKFSDLSMQVIYALSAVTRVNLEGSMRKQEGRGIDLELATGRFSIETAYRNIRIIGGVEGYKKDFLQDRQDYIRGYIRVERRF